MKYHQQHFFMIFLTVVCFLFVPSTPALHGHTSAIQSAPGAGTADYSGHIRSIEQYVRENMKVFQVPGLAIGFYKDDFTWVRGFGFADLENEVRVTPDTLFRMASVTKPMTAAAIIRLASEGKLKLDDEVQLYAADFPKKQWPVTIRQLLSHLGGISHYRDYDAEAHFKTHYNTAQALAVFKDWPLEAEPGTRFNYSSYGYNLLGAVIEGASGQSYGEYMTQSVWQPLAMNHTCMDIAEKIIRGRTRGYQVVDGKIKNCEFVDISSRFAAGGILCTVKDMLSFCKGLDKGTVLPWDIQAEMYNLVETKDKHFTEYGLGWRLDFVSGYWNVEHGGGQTGTSTYILRFPGEKFAAAVATNLEGHNTYKYAQAVARNILGAYHIQPWSASPSEYFKLHLIWHTGLGYFDRHGQPFTMDEKELAAAFAYINAITASDKEARKKVQDGLHPLTGSPVFKIGSHMANCLAGAYGEDKLDDYRCQGAIPFFAAYIDLYKKDRAIPQAYRFSRQLEKLVGSWNKEWQQTWTADTKALFTMPLSYLTGNKEKEQARQIFKGKQVIPVLEFEDCAREMQRTGKLDKGIELMQAAVEIYPRIPELYYTLGEFQLDKKQYPAALEVYKKAVAIEKNKALARHHIQWTQDLVRNAEKPATVAVEILNKYVGNYGPRHVTIEGGVLYYQRDRRDKFRLIPLDENTFALDGLSVARMRFVADKEGKITKIVGLYIDGSSDENPRD